MTKKIIWGAVVGLLAAVMAAGLWAASYLHLLPQRAYTAEDFGIETVRGGMDFNGNGVDDYTDLLLGARRDGENHPRYDGTYWEGGFPPENIGVCTDVVWRAFREAGYNLREMVDKDISLRPGTYPAVDEPDKNIDFRRVRNLRVFFEEYAVPLTLDIDEIESWQPGDIVIFGENKHIGIVSDKRDREGHAWIIHNGGQPRREEDYLGRGTVTGHYRFDAALADPDLLISWEN